MKRKVLVTLAVIFGIAGLAAASAAFWYHHHFHAAAFRPVQLSEPEQRTLHEKLAASPAVSDPSKTIVLSEREINGWLQQQGLGEHVKVDISSGAIAATTLLPVPAEVPFVGGRTVRFKIALKTQFDARRHLGLFVSDITVGGISPPNAWLGGIKGKDLLADAVNDPLAKGFADGIKSLNIGSGEIRVVLND